MFLINILNLQHDVYITKNLQLSLFIHQVKNMTETIHLRIKSDEVSVF